MVSRLGSLRRAFLVSATFPVAAILSAQSGNAQVVIGAPTAPATTTPSATVNSQIFAAASAGGRDLDVKITSDAAIAGPPDVQVFSPAAGKADGKITFSNAGKIGATSADGTTVTNSTGVDLFGVGSGTKDNTAVATNSGLITNAIFISGFGGDVSFANSGTIYGGIFADGFGNVSVTSGGTGSIVRTGGINATADQLSTTTTTGGVTTTTVTGGTAKIVASSDVGTTANKGGVTASSVSDANVTVSALAGAVTANGTNSATTTSQPGTAAAGKTVTTSATSTTFNPSNATVTIATGGNVDSALSVALTNSTVNVSTGAKVANAANATSAIVSDSVGKQTVTQNAAGVTTQTTSNSAFTTRGAASLIAIDTGGSVGNATALGLTSAAVTNAGTVTGNASAQTSQTNSTTNSVTTNFSDAGVRTSQRVINTAAPAGGAASVANAKGGAIQGSVFVSGDGGATITNAGTIGVTATPVSVTGASSRNVQLLNDTNTTYAADGNTVTAQAINRENKTVGSATSFTNTADGLVNATSVSLSAVGPITIANAGTVRGPITANSSGTDTVFQDNFTQSSTTTAPAAPALPVTTAVTSDTQSTTTTQVGGSVTGTYSGVNGTLNFTPVASGSISQFATTDSVATISGTVFGSVNASGGAFGNNTVNTSKTDTSRVTNTAGVGSNTFSTSSTFVSTSVAGTGTVNVTGKVALGDANVTPTVTVSGPKAATATITNGTLEAGLQVTSAGISTNNQTNANSYTQALAAGLPTSTTALSNSSANQFTYTDGVATATLTGTSTTGTNANSGTVSVSGNTATATVGVGSRVGTNNFTAGLNVTANTFDSSNSDSVTYTRDPTTTVVAATGTTTNAFAPTATAGNATATVGGTVTGTTTVSAGGGNATATINGNTASVTANSNGTKSSSTTTNTYAGKAAGTTATSYNTASLDSALAAIKTGSTTTTSNTQVGGKATVLVDSSDAVKAAASTATPNNVGVTGSVSASGVGGASVTVTSGSQVGGTASTFSRYTGTTSTVADTYTAGIRSASNSTSTSTPVGASAVVTNAGTIAGSVFATGTTSAEIANTGRIGTIGVGGSNFSANALGLSTTTTVVDTSIDNVAQENQVTKAVQTAVGGAAKFSNAAGALAIGNVALAGGTGTFTNDGTVAGTTTLGGTPVNDYTLTTTKTASTTTLAVAQPATLFTQTYTANQNGTSGGFVVGAALDGTTFRGPATGGVLITDPSDTTGTRTLQTTTLNATINLNNGSATLGNITAQTDSKTGARLTNTTVNLNGAGFLGTDFVIPTNSVATTLTPVAVRTPELVLTKDATTVLGLTNATGSIAYSTPVRVIGVNTLAKNGAGTFVIVGQQYLSSTTAGAAPIYTLDVGNFNINAGEVQLAIGSAGAIPAGYTASNEFAINGNVTIASGGSLVLGRRVPTAIQGQVGTNLTGTGESIAGITVREVGNFTQAAGGTLVVGATPSLVRFANVAIANAGTSNETLGVITSSVTVPYFTTAQNAGVASANSTLNVTGNLTLAGNVLVEVSRDGIYSTGDGYTLASYTGTGTITGTATSTLSSPFVKFALVNDTATKTVRLSATRSSFTSVAADPNAAAAAAGLDSAISTIVSRIRTDAAGGAGFSSVSQIGYAQDLANIVNALDFRLSGAQATEVFQELSSAELYGSLSAVNQNAVFGDTVNQLTGRRAYGEALGTRIWINPAGSFAKYGNQKYGASRIKVDSYGVAGGIDLAYSDEGAIGIGGAYGKHDVNSIGNADKADISTYTVGAYVTQGFDRFYVNGTFAYGFSRFNAVRQLSLLARSINGSFHGTQLDAALEGGYDFRAGRWTVTPFAKAALRRYTMDSFTETNGGGASLAVLKRSKSIFSPVVGLKVGGAIGDLEGLALRPYGKLSYTFQGHLGEDRTVQFLGGGDPFILRGVDPRGYGTAELGLDGSLTPRLGVFVSGGYSFAGHNEVATIRGGLGFKF